MAKRADRRDLILASAASVFARYGYAKTTLDDVGLAVRLNKASLYYYFPGGKDDLFIAVVLRESGAFMAALAERVAALPTPEARIEEYLIGRLRYYKHVLNLHQLSVENLQVLEPRFDQLYATIRDEEIAFLQRLLTALPGPHPPRLALLLLTVADALKHESLRTAGPQALTAVDYSAIEADTRLVVRLILAGVSVGTVPV